MSHSNALSTFEVSAHAHLDQASRLDDMSWVVFKAANTLSFIRDEREAEAYPAAIVSGLLAQMAEDERSAARADFDRALEEIRSAWAEDEYDVAYTATVRAWEAIGVS